MKLYDKNKKGRGRPKKNKTEMHHIAFRISNDLHQRVLNITKESAGSVSGYIRDALVHKLRLDELALRQMGIDIKK